MVPSDTIVKGKYQRIISAKGLGAIRAKIGPT
jgi:hypothetical protein